MSGVQCQCPVSVQSLSYPETLGRELGVQSHDTCRGWHISVHLINMIFTPTVLLPPGPGGCHRIIVMFYFKLCQEARSGHRETQTAALLPSLLHQSRESRESFHWFVIVMNDVSSFNWTLLVRHRFMYISILHSRWPKLEKFLAHLSVECFNSML